MQGVLLPPLLPLLLKYLHCMKWNFHRLCYSKIFKSIILWLVIFKFGLRTSAYDFFLQLRSWPIRVKMCEILCTVKICKLVQLVIRCVKRPSYHGIWEDQGKEWEVLASCKTPLTWKALSFLYLRKMKSEEHIVGNLFSPTAKWRMHLCYFPLISNKYRVAIDSF